MKVNGMLLKSPGSYFYIPTETGILVFHKNPMLNRRILNLLFFFLFLCTVCSAQKRTAAVAGKVVNEREENLPDVSVQVLGSPRGTSTNDSGFFTLNAAAGKAFALVFSFSGYQTVQKNFLLAEGETEHVNIRLEQGAATLQEVIVHDNRQRTEVGLIRPNPKSVINLPSAITGVESLIKIFVGSNNELTSQYNVRGGSYDENLIYVNDFEIFRPYLVRSGQQEGLSFINPELVRNISFYNGGFQARYGDKMSSVLDIQYNKPQRFGGSAYISLLEQGIHLEDSKKRLAMLWAHATAATRTCFAPSLLWVRTFRPHLMCRRWFLTGFQTNGRRSFWAIIRVPGFRSFRNLPN
jgi:hypothetical protein